MHHVIGRRVSRNQSRPSMFEYAEMRLWEYAFPVIQHMNVSMAIRLKRDLVEGKIS